MYSGVLIGMLIDLANKQGAYHQLTLIETPPEYEIKEEHLCSLFSGYSCTLSETGNSHGITSTVDHPAFTALREHLESKGYLKVQRSWCNGDEVLKEFKLNGKTFFKGNRFPSAGAMKMHLKHKDEKEDSTFYCRKVHDDEWI